MRVRLVLPRARIERSLIADRRRLPDAFAPALEMLAWGIGGVIALIGAFVYAELAAIRPNVGGQYAYLRDAYHPIVAFLYGWTLLLVVQTGGMAGAAIVFGNYFREIAGVGLPASWLAVIALSPAGFGVVDPEIAWAKLATLAEGARRVR